MKDFKFMGCTYWICGMQKSGGLYLIALFFSIQVLYLNEMKFILHGKLLVGVAS